MQHYATLGRLFKILNLDRNNYQHHAQVGQAWKRKIALPALSKTQEARHRAHDVDQPCLVIFNEVPRLL